MAVWKLDQPHYLRVPGTKYQHTEQLQGAKRATRVDFDVPMLLDPRDASDHNFNGMILVAHGASKQYPQALEFLGPPTPDMTPMDEEAEKITEATKASWKNPMELVDVDAGGYAAGIEKLFAQQLDALRAMSAGGQSAPIPAEAVSKSEFEELKALTQQLMEQNAQLMAQLAEGKPEGRRA